MALLDSSLTSCKSQFFITSGFTTPSFTPNASSEHGTWEISSVENIMRKGEEGVGSIAVGFEIIWDPRPSHSDSVGLG